MGAKKKLKEELAGKQSTLEIQAKVIQAERKKNETLKKTVTRLNSNLKASKWTCDKLQLTAEAHRKTEKNLLDKITELECKKHTETLHWTWMKPNRAGLWWCAGLDVSKPSLQRDAFYAFSGEDLEGVTEGYWCLLGDIPYVNPGLKIKETTK